MSAAIARAPYAWRLRFAIRSRRICCGSYVRHRAAVRDSASSSILEFWFTARFYGAQWR